jgi:hypothetical protein
MAFYGGPGGLSFKQLLAVFAILAPIPPIGAFFVNRGYSPDCAIITYGVAVAIVFFYRWKKNSSPPPPDDQ